MEDNDDIFCIGDLLSEEIKQSCPETKRLKIHRQEFITSAIESGILDDLWDSDEDNHRYGRTKTTNGVCGYVIH